MLEQSINKLMIEIYDQDAVNSAAGCCYCGFYSVEFHSINYHQLLLI